MWSNRRNDDSEEVRRLQRQVENMEYENERRREREYQEQEDRRKERLQEMLQRGREASSWPEAFRKNRSLYVGERNQCYAGPDESEDYKRDMDKLREGWEKSIGEIDLAAQIWAVEQEAIDLAILQARMRVSIALREANPNSELADYIEQNDIDGWMNW